MHRWVQSDFESNFGLFSAIYTNQLSTSDTRSFGDPIERILLWSYADLPNIFCITSGPMPPKKLTKKELDEQKKAEALKRDDDERKQREEAERKDLEMQRLRKIEEEKRLEEERMRLQK